jgi:ADP-ribose pyrophosphatase YjhB (NUDIX family)
MNVRVAGVLRRGESILTLKYEYPDGIVYGLPGGGVEDHEDCETALVREFQEEVGLTVTLGDLLYTGDMMASEKRKRTLHLVFSVICEQGMVPRLNAAETTANALVWLPEQELAAVALYPDVGRVLSQDLKGNLIARHLGNCMMRKWA